MSARQSLIGELEAALQSGSRDRRATALRAVTDLFLSNTERYDDEQIQLFDDVLLQMTRQIETKALAELSGRLAPVANAPTLVIRRLAADDDIKVAGPVLEQSPRLSSSDLVEIAQGHGESHALAISGRTKLDASVTDVLLEKEFKEVDRRLAGNSGAAFSDQGFSTLVQRAEGDEVLAERVSTRRELTPELMQQLVTRATEKVRARLLASRDPQQQARVRQVLASLANETAREMAGRKEFGPAQRRVQEMHDAGQLDENALLGFAQSRRFEETICALSLMCKCPIELFERLLAGTDNSGLLIPCRAAGFAWTTVGAILRLRPQGISEMDIAQARTDFQQLTRASAERVVRFWHVRETTTRDPAGSAMVQ
jgi:uncharacterized protein (DUF2336 family)